MTKYPEPKRVVFITGFPRSGTTLLQSLMCTHSALVSIPETFFFTNLVALLQDKKDQLKLDKTSKIQVLNFLEMRLGLGFRQKLAANENYNKLKGIYNITDFFILWYKIIYEISGQQKELNSNYWLEKTPDHVHFLKEIQLTFPNAFFIHIVRHPIFAVHSAARYFYPGFLLQYDRAANNWNKAQLAFKAFNQVYPNQTYELYYEDLIANPEAVLQSIFDRLDLSFDSQNLSKLSQTVGALVAEKEAWKQNNFSNIRKQERKITLRQCLDGSTFIIQYHTSVHLKEKGMTIHNRFFQLYIFNYMYYPIDKGLKFASFFKRKIFKWLKS